MFGAASGASLLLVVATVYRVFGIAIGRDMILKNTIAPIRWGSLPIVALTYLRNRIRVLWQPFGSEVQACPASTLCVIGPWQRWRTSGARARCCGHEACLGSPREVRHDCEIMAIFAPWAVDEPVLLLSLFRKFFQRRPSLKALRIASGVTSANQ